LVNHRIVDITKGVEIKDESPTAVERVQLWLYAYLYVLLSISSTVMVAIGLLYSCWKSLVLLVKSNAARLPVSLMCCVLIRLGSSFLYHCSAIVLSDMKLGVNKVWVAGTIFKPSWWTIKAATLYAFVACSTTSIPSTTSKTSYNGSGAMGLQRFGLLCHQRPPQGVTNLVDDLGTTVMKNQRPYGKMTVPVNQYRLTKKDLKRLQKGVDVSSSSLN
jgi:hypothetical protein